MLSEQSKTFRIKPSHSWRGPLQNPISDGIWIFRAPQAPPGRQNRVLNSDLIQLALLTSAVDGVIKA